MWARALLTLAYAAQGCTSQTYVMLEMYVWDPDHSLVLVLYIVLVRTFLHMCWQQRPVLQVRKQWQVECDARAKKLEEWERIYGSQHRALQQQQQQEQEQHQ